MGWVLLVLGQCKVNRASNLKWSLTLRGQSRDRYPCAGIETCINPKPKCGLWISHAKPWLWPFSGDFAERVLGELGV